MIKLTKEEFKELSMPMTGTPKIDLRPMNVCIWAGIEYTIETTDKVNEYVYLIEVSA